MATKVELMKATRNKIAQSLLEMDAKIQETQLHETEVHNQNIEKKVLSLQEKIKELLSTKIPAQTETPTRKPYSPCGFAAKGEGSTIIINHIENSNGTPFKIKDIVQSILNAGEYKGTSKTLYANVFNTIKQMCQSNKLQRNKHYYQKVSN